MGVIDDKLAEWVDERVLTAAQADKVRAYEASRPSAAAVDDGSVPTWLEVLGYIGSVLVVSGVAYLLFASWSSLAVEGKVAIAAALLVITAGLGLVLHPLGSRAAQRLSSLLLFIAVHLVAWVAIVVTEDVLDVEPWETSVLVVALAAGLAAVGVYVLRRTALTVILLIYAAVAVTDAILVQPAISPPGEWIVFALGVVCLVAAAAAILGWLTPRRPAMIFAGLWSVLLIDIATWWGGSRIVLLPLALAVAGAYLALAIVRRGDGALIIPGGLGVLVVLPQLIHHLFGESLLTWLTVIAVGLAMLALVVWRARGGRSGGGSAPLARDEI